MKSCFFGMLCILLYVLPVSAEAEHGMVYVAFDNYPPYHYWDGVNPRGLNIELLDEVSSRLGIEMEYVRRSWQRSMFDVEMGEVTGLCAGMKTAERERFAVYPIRPLSLETNWVVSLAGSGVRVRDLDGLRGLSVGVVSGYVYDKEFDAMSDLKKQESKTDTLLLRKLLNGRLDVIVGNDLVLKHLAAKMGVSNRLDFQFKLHSEPLYLILSKRQAGTAELAAKISATLEAMQQDGSYDAILDRY